MLTIGNDIKEEAMTESGKSLSNSKNYCSVFEKISKINDVKQNEKHPFTFVVFVVLGISGLCTLDELVTSKQIQQNDKFWLRQAENWLE